MKHALVLALCVQLLLQVPLPVLAKPDFGITLTITGSSKVSLAANNANPLLLAVDDNTPLTTQSNYAGLQELANLLTQVASLTSNLGGQLVPLVTTLVSDTSGDVAAMFTPVLDKIADIKNAVSTELVIATNAIQDLVGMYVPDQLNDGFGRLVVGLDDLMAKLQMLKKAIDDAILIAGTMANLTDALVKKYVKPVLVYNVVFAINQLKAYVPVVKYTIDSTLENIKLADEYVLLVNSAVSTTSPSSSQLIGPVKTVTDAIANAVITELNKEKSDFGNLQTGVGDLTQLTSATDIGKVNSALTTYGTKFDSLSTDQYPAMNNELQALINTMTQAISSSTSSGPVSSKLLDSLILTVIENGKFAQFCFYKYLGLVLDSLSSSSGGIGPCIDKEIKRLTHLLEMLPLLMELLPFDYEDILDELSICNMLTDSVLLNECITPISGYFTDLVNEFGIKLKSLFEVIQSETLASANRFLVCFELSKLGGPGGSNQKLTDAIRQCALKGPTADD